MNKPLVDVYVLSYKRPHFLRLMLDSLIGQDYPEIRITVIDNASTAETREVLNAYANRYSNFSYRAFSDAGFDRFNISLLWSDADFVFMPHDDDVVASDWVSRAVDVLHSNPTIGAVFSRYHSIDDVGNQLHTSTFGYPPGLLEIDSFVAHFVMTGELPIVASGVYRMDTIRKYNIRIENPRVVGVALDVQLLRDLNAVSEMYCVDYGGYRYRSHGGQTAVTMALEAMCSAIYIVSSTGSSDRKVAKRMLGAIAEYTLCQSKPLTVPYKFSMRILRWICKRDLYISTKFLNPLIKIFRRNLGTLVLHGD